MRRSQEEKVKIIHLVEHSDLPKKHTLDELNVPRSSFFRWYRKFQEDGEEGLIDRRPNPGQSGTTFRRECKYSNLGSGKYLLLEANFVSKDLRTYTPFLNHMTIGQWKN